jgi:hypothetical protein
MGWIESKQLKADVEHLQPAAELPGNDMIAEPKEKRMTRFHNSIALGLAASVLILGLSACEKKEGPAERAGKQVDKAVQSTGQQIEKVGEQIQDAAKDAKK